MYFASHYGDWCMCRIYRRGSESVQISDLVEKYFEAGETKSVNVVKVNGKKISNETLQGVYAYFSAYVFVFGISVLLVALDNFDFATTISGVLTTLSNVGPGISRVGPIENFQSFSVLSKIVFSMDMLIGRLEIFPFLMICSPSFWRKHF